MRRLKINFLSLLEKFFDAHFEDGNPNNEIEYVKAFIDAYDLGYDKVLILSYLNHYFPSYVVESKLCDIVDDELCISGLNELNELMSKQFIVKHRMGDGRDCYAIAEKVRDSFKDGIIIGKSYFADCYQELKAVTLPDIQVKRWQDTFYESVEEAEDSQLYDALSTLGVESWDSDLQNAFWVLIWQFVNNFTSPFSFGKLSDDSDNSAKLRKAMRELVKMGMAVTLPIEPLEDTKDTERYVIAVKVVELLFHGHDEFIRYDDISKQVNVILAKDIEEKELFFPENCRKEVDNIRRILSPEGFRRAKAILRKQKRNPGIQSLFWGPPGTGKTEIVKQLARESGRDILMYDAAKVTASAWGATEKFMRALFLGYSYLVAVSDRAPILVLNEADQLLGKRLSDVSTSIARSENIISNIVLQGFEDMSGILLATTNLAKNMDEAFDRRFLFKTELPRPDASTRKRIWKSSIPELTDDEAGKLADRFNMSGGQISNVVAKRNLAELYYDGDRGYNYIAGLCRNETEEPISGTSRKVGF